MKTALYSISVLAQNKRWMVNSKCNCFQEGTQALRELLQIGEKQTLKPELPVRGKQLSLDELFRSQSKYMCTLEII